MSAERHGTPAVRHADASAGAAGSPGGSNPAEGVSAAMLAEADRLWLDRQRDLAGDGGTGWITMENIGAQPWEGWLAAGVVAAAIVGGGIYCWIVLT